jgi:hypothetical protein
MPNVTSERQRVGSAGPQGRTRRNPRSIFQASQTASLSLSERDQRALGHLKPCYILSSKISPNCRSYLNGASISRCISRIVCSEISTDAASGPYIVIGPMSPVLGYRDTRVLMLSATASTACSCASRRRML